MSEQPITKPVGLRIPQGLRFADLKLSRHLVDGDVSFDWAPINAICEASDIDVAVFSHSDEDNVAGLIVAWYQVHREAGGEIDLVAEQLIAEVQAEGIKGQASVQNGPGTLQ